MVGKRTLGLMAAIILLLIPASPLAAEETILLDIPGCSS